MSDECKCDDSDKVTCCDGRGLCLATQTLKVSIEGETKPIIVFGVDADGNRVVYELDIPCSDKCHL